MWAERGLPGTLHDVTPTFFCAELLNIDLSDPDNTCKVEGLGKGMEIRAWLQRHARPDCRYVIIDDVAGFEGELREHAVRINPKMGIIETDAKGAMHF